MAECLSCARPLDRSLPRAQFCYECAEQRAREQQRAINRVRSAVERGEIPPARDRECVDCGEPAANYDHRDYLFPLMVEPVCARCNVARGPALDSQMRALPALGAALSECFSSSASHGIEFCPREPLNTTQQIREAL